MREDPMMMTEHELLAELVREKRRNETLRYIRYGIIRLLVLAAVIGFNDIMRLFS